MNTDTSFLRTRVARRIVVLFFLCALLPSSALAIVAFSYVTSQLSANGRERLEEIGRLTKDALLERLTSLQTNVGILASGIASGVPMGLSDSTLSARFVAASLQLDGRSPTAVLGTPRLPPQPEDDVRQQLRAGATVLQSEDGSGVMEAAEIVIGRALDLTNPDKGILWAEIDPAYLATGGEFLPRQTELCVFNAAKRPLYCSPPVSEVSEAILDRINVEIASRPIGEADRGHFEWSHQGEQYMAWYQSVYLRAWSASDWTIVISEPKAVVLAGRADFWKFFIRVVVLALLVVMLASYVQIRKSMAPLIELQSGTRRIAHRDFGSQVRVSSGDEFEDLANSFNEMAGTLHKQFNALTAINEIDRAVLAALNIETIVDTILSSTQRVMACDGLSVGLAVPNGDGQWKLAAIAASSDEKVVRDIRISARVVEQFRAHPGHLWLDGEEPRPSYIDISLFNARGISSFLTLPIYMQEQLAGVIALGYRTKPVFSDEDMVQARQLADQVAVALSNTRLIEELDALKVGALTAFANTIDAKSHWTSGHSERVTKTSLLVGQQLGLTEKELEIINRGGLLHDIGKIGIPPEILDKPAKLTPEERQVMQDHVTVGARILEPIAAYADVIPIVLRHHERFAGGGYPDGLVGEEIDFYARVLAVGDVYDAVTSSRPYRSGMPKREAIALIERESGSHFDPTVVDAFLAVVRQPQIDVTEAAAPVYRPVDATMPQVVQPR